MKAVVIEDSRLAREGLVNMLRAFPAIHVVGAADHPVSARDLIIQHAPDLIFLDIHMPGENGFELLETLEYSPKIIFTTAYSEYAIRSFDFNTIDYLLKPISHDRLSIAIQKLTAISAHRAKIDDELPHDILDFHSRIFVKDGDHCHIVNLSDIRYFESCKNYVRIFFENHNAFIKKSLNSVEMRLPRKYFFRVSRQYIVNIQKIKRIEESISDGFDVTMSDGAVIQVSRRNASELKEQLSF